MTVTKVTSLADFNKAISFDGLTVVDFYATWCGPCKMIAPVLDNLSNNNPEAQFLKIDVEEAADIALEYSIAAMPTIFFFKKGEKVADVVGANIGQIQALVQQHKS